MFKPIYIDGELVSPKVIFETYPELAFGGGFSALNATVGVNERDDITAVVKEGVERLIKGVEYTEEEQSRVNDFKALYRPDMPIYTYQNPPALCQVSK